MGSMAGGAPSGVARRVPRHARRLTSPPPALSNEREETKERKSLVRAGRTDEEEGRLLFLKAPRDFY
jgi:hypothetical protein